jgi:hypothetical protein
LLADRRVAALQSDGEDSACVSEEGKAGESVTSIREQSEQLLRFFAHPTIGLEDEGNQTPTVFLAFLVVLVVLLCLVLCRGDERFSVAFVATLKLGAAGGTTHANVDEDLLVMTKKKK